MLHSPSDDVIDLNFLLRGMSGVSFNFTSYLELDIPGRRVHTAPSCFQYNAKLLEELVSGARKKLWREGKEACGQKGAFFRFPRVVRIEQ